MTTPGFCKTLSLVFGLAAACSLQAGEIQPSYVLSKARVAIGLAAMEEFARKTGGIQLSGDCSFMGEKGSYDLLFGGNNFLESVRGRLSQTVGFDGTTCWATDWSGMPRKLKLEDEEAEQAAIWIYTGRWLAKESPFQTTSFTAASGDVKVHFRLRGRILEGDLLLDGKSYLLKKYTRQSPSGMDTWQYSDYTAANGFKLARKLKNTNAGLTNTFQIKKVEQAPIFIRNPYAPLFSIPADTTFSSAESKVEVKKAISGHLLVHPLVNGKDVGWFILDSGAGAMVIDPRAADVLGLPKLGQLSALGIGGVVNSSLRKAKTISLGPMSVSNPIFVQLDLSAISAIFGVKIAGICGYDFISRAVLEMDLVEPSLKIFDPKTYSLSKGTWQEMWLHGKTPVVFAEFEGARNELFRLDTGANNALIVHTPTVEKYRLLAKREISNTKLGGFGGFIDAKSGKLAYFTLGGRRFENPKVDFSLAKTGPLSDPYTAGNIGQGFLRQFVLVFDYQKNRMAFVAKQ